VKCIFTDPDTGFLIFGGKSTSSTFAPAENDHGYMVALDQNGYWQWGNFFYNVSYSVQDITGCSLTSNGTYIYAFGEANSKPVVMLLNKDDGLISRFVTIDQISEDLEEYDTRRAIFVQDG
jgi:hypothetical protein